MVVTALKKALMVGHSTWIRHENISYVSSIPGLEKDKGSLFTFDLLATHFSLTDLTVHSDCLHTKEHLCTKCNGLSVNFQGAIFTNLT